MRYLAIATLFVFCSVTCSTQISQAKPAKRYDARTKMCRELDKGSLDWDSEIWGMGGIKFREVCKSCHAKDNSQGFPFVHAETYTSEAWNSFFTNRKSICATDGSWAALSDEELQLVNDYLYRNANWTYDPNNAESCG